MATRLAVILGGLLCLGAGTAPAPETRPLAEGEPHHRLQFSTSAVKVLSVNVPPKATMLYHRHPTEQLILVVRPGRLRNEVIGRPPAEHHTGEPGTVVSIAAGSVHRQTNLGAAPSSWVGVEMIRPEGSFAFGDWPATVNRGGTRIWEPGAVPWRALGGGRLAVTLWSDAGSGERGELEKLAPGQRRTVPSAARTERIVPLVGKLTYQGVASGRPLAPGVLAEGQPHEAAACDAGAECVYLVVSS